ncbi:MAG: SxtJ family membrane protein [Candidatus Omnitrophota bacterium]|nr:SxtJ family membrane protein [Candidatus Omnitrophota bacterium]
MRDEIKAIKSDKKALREFGLTIGAILVILGGVGLWRSRPAWPYFLGAGFILIALGLSLPPALRPFQRIWMAFSIVIGFFSSRLILVILFYALITPMSLIMKILRRDVLDERIDRGKASYWIYRSGEKKSRESYENQY